MTGHDTGTDGGRNIGTDTTTDTGTGTGTGTATDTGGDGPGGQGDPDTGLLSPVRAGTPVEAAVSDTAWVQAMLDAEAALARAQCRLGAVPASAAAAISAAARAELLDIRALARGSRENANPVVGLVKAFTAVVAAQDPAAAEFVHLGSTSQDIFDTGAMLVCRRALGIIRDDLERTADALSVLAREHRDTAMAGRTLALHAVPTTFGLKAAGWRHLLLDAVERVNRLLDGGLPVSLGGAAGTLAGYLQYAGQDAVGADATSGTDAAGGLASGAHPDDYLDRLAAAFAQETGLAPQQLPWHVLRTPMADLAATLGFTAGALGKVAVDLLSLARTEVGELVEPTVAGRGASSAMPHKRNPVLATLIRSAALQVPVLAAGLTQCLMAEDERAAGVWQAEWQLLRECLRLTGGAAHTAVELAEGVSVRQQRMRENLDLTGGQVVSERLVAVLAPRLGKAAAKQLLSSASEDATRSGGTLLDALGGRPELDGLLTDEGLAELLDPTRYTGAAGPLVDRALRREVPRTS
jgi:3-carboxy-cis,cis-muconate cycloisomerase